MQRLTMLFILVTLLCYHFVHNIRLHRQIVMQYGDKFYVRKKQYSMEQIQDYLQRKTCTGLKYTHYLKKEGCMHVPVSTMLCGGQCLSTFPPFGTQNKRKGRQCTSCGPIHIVEQEYGMLCQKNHSQGATPSLRIEKVKVKVIKRCGCSTYQCLEGILDTKA